MPHSRISSSDITAFMLHSACAGVSGLVFGVGVLSFVTSGAFSVTAVGGSGGLSLGVVELAAAGLLPAGVVGGKADAGTAGAGADVDAAGVAGLSFLTGAIAVSALHSVVMINNKNVKKKFIPSNPCALKNTSILAKPRRIFKI